MTKGLIFGEGHGESESARNLISRLWLHLGLDPTHVWTKVYRSSTLNTEDGIKKACEFARAEAFDKLLILRDEDDHCPRDVAPEAAQWIRGRNEVQSYETVQFGMGVMAPFLSKSCS